MILPSEQRSALQTVPVVQVVKRVTGAGRPAALRRLVEHIRLANDSPQHGAPPQWCG